MENRTNRPHVELCTDLPLEGLVAEVQSIKSSIQMLEDKLDNARYNYNDVCRNPPPHPTGGGGGVMQGGPKSRPI